MANSNAMARSDADKNHVGASMMVIDSNGDVGKVAFKGKVDAWVTFNGTLSSITVAGGHGVSSITDNGVGNYTINFATAQPDVNYCAIGGVGMSSGYPLAASPVLKTTTSVGLRGADANGGYQDGNNCSLLVVR